MAPHLPGVEMHDPHTPGRIVWVVDADRADFEKRGYTAIPSQAERKARPVEPVAPSTVPKAASDAGGSNPAAPPATDAGAPDAEAVTAFLAGNVPAVTARVAATSDAALLRAVLAAETAKNQPRKGVVSAIESRADALLADEAYGELVHLAQADELTVEALEAWDIDELIESLEIEDVPEDEAEKIAAIAKALRDEAAQEDQQSEGAPPSGGVTFPRRAGHSSAPRG